MMQHFTVTTCNTVWRFTAINLMTILLVIAGGIVFGLGPAFAACLWAMSRPDDPPIGSLCRGMWVEWRAEFVRTNLVLTPIASVLIVLLLALAQVQGPALAVLIGIFALMVELALATVYVVSQVRCTVAVTIGNASRLLMVAPVRLLAVLAVMIALVFVTVWQPLFGLYGLFSVAAWLCIALLGAMHDQAHRTLSPEIQQPEALS